MTLLARISVALSFVAMFALALGCNGPSAEAMEKEWHGHKENVQKYEAKYPAFKTALEALLGDAQKDFDAAKTADEKTRGDKIKAVNDRVASSIKMFEGYESELDKQKKLLEDKALQDLPASKFNPAADAAKAAVAKAEALIKDAKPANMGEAKAKIEEATKSLQDGGKDLAALKASVATSAKAAGPAPSATATASAKAK